MSLIIIIILIIISHITDHHSSDSGLDNNQIKRKERPTMPNEAMELENAIPTVRTSHPLSEVVEAESDDKNQCEVLHNLAMQLKKLKEISNPLNNMASKFDSQVPRNNGDMDEPSNSNNNNVKPARKLLSIPWRGRILAPSISQLRECKGKLDRLETHCESRAMKEEEKHYKFRVFWRKWVMWPTIQELEDAEGDLNNLIDICSNKLKLSEFTDYNYNRHAMQSNNDDRHHSHTLMIDHWVDIPNRDLTHPKN